jgi:uncharacterized protein
VILLDTSGLLAAYDRDDAFHQGVVQALSGDERRILSPFVLAELDYLLATRAGQGVELQALQDVARGAYELAALTEEDVQRCIEVMERYADLCLGLADASVVVLARRFSCSNVLSFDQRHFRALHAPSGQGFRMLPLDA